MGRKGRNAGEKEKQPKGAPKGASSGQCESGQPETEPRAAINFPVVGIGASAGGLEALEHFFAHVPCDSGMSYVVIQHLDPTHKGILPELLQRSTRMKVVQVRQGTKIRPNMVYVIPANKDMAVEDGKLRLSAPTAPRGLRLPIDFFLRSLARECGERGAAVILSGMGSDGVLGLQAVKETAGVVLVQEPASAKFDCMPRTAIDTGMVDIVAPPEELPAKLLTLFQKIPRGDAISAPDSTPRNALDELIGLLRTHTGHDFSLYKKSTISRRVERRMGIHQIDTIQKYIRYLRENPHETNLLFKELLIGVTRFFRDAPAWNHLREHALPDLLKRNPASRQLRAWTPGCSTGEEAYSLAMAFREAQDSLDPPRHCQLQIFATDLDPEAVDKARQAFYPANIAADVSDERLARFFVKEDDGYRVTTEIRERVVFAPQDVVTDPPLYQDRYPGLPKPADLHGGGTSEDAFAFVSLQPQARGYSFSGECGNHRRLHEPFRERGEEVQDLSSSRGKNATRYVNSSVLMHPR